ncbi:MAG: hypothetical protein HQL53_07770 [Magnetococcales bacterium]|nr:hypothetical protein [Magnetococcales bacterium]
METPANPLLLLEGNERPPNAQGTPIYWALRDIPDGALSLPSLVDEMGDRLREEYLAWIAVMATRPIAGLALEKRMQIGAHPSFWHLSLLAEKSTLKSPNTLFSIMKLRALELTYHEGHHDALNLCVSDPRLIETLVNWCRQCKIPYRNHAPFPPIEPLIKPPRSHRLPHLIQALMVLARYIGRWARSLGSGSPHPFSKRSVTLCGYFPNIDMIQAAKGQLVSKYWGKLPELLIKRGMRLNWIWIHVPGGELSYSESLKLRRELDRQSEDHQRFMLLEESLGFAGILRGIIMFSRLALRRIPGQALREGFQLPGSNLNFWPVARHDWQRSKRGAVAMENALLATIFQRLAEAHAPDTPCFYIMENQAWERLLTSSWRRWRRGRTLGVMHSIVRFFDPRNYDHPTLLESPAYKALRPDLQLMNGSGARHFVEGASQPLNRYREVEALRFLYLGGIQPENNHDKRQDKSSRTRKRTLLVITDYIRFETEGQLRLLAGAAAKGGCDGFDEILVKPHPFYPVDEVVQQLGLENRVTLTDTPLNQLWPKVDLVYSSNQTTAVVEAMRTGRLPILIHIGADGLNLSPLWGHPRMDSVQFVGSAETLHMALQSPPPAGHLDEDFFHLDPGLSRWQRLLDEEIS